MNAYPQPTQNALARALGKSAAERTRADKTLLLLSDGAWVNSLTLALHGGGLSYNARICELRRSGVRIKARRRSDSPKGEQWFQYRLVTADEIPQKG
jgi:hypothetical protein